MARTVTADHILFDECIEAFRREGKDHAPARIGLCKSHIITSFEIMQSWNLGICVVNPSIRMILPSGHFAFISTVENPDWARDSNPQLFGIALSAIISFVTHKVCKSTRDSYLCRREQLTQKDLFELAVINPILIAGPGSTRTSLSRERLILMEQDVRNIIVLLNKIEYNKYRVVMQSIRMVHLSIINKREDFGLGYLLVVSAIEAIAQHTISRKKMKQSHPSAKVWKGKAKDDESFAELLKAYEDASSKNQYIKERYVKFINDYAPVNNWNEYVQHPMEEMTEDINCIPPSEGINYIVEKYPNQLEPILISNILGDSYKHRSCFIHRGEQPPHRDPNPTFHRFFQEDWKFNGTHIEKTILPTYQLLLAISKHSMLNWLSTCVK